MKSPYREPADVVPERGLRWSTTLSRFFVRLSCLVTIGEPWRRERDRKLRVVRGAEARRVEKRVEFEARLYDAEYGERIKPRDAALLRALAFAGEPTARLEEMLTMYEAARETGRRPRTPPRPMAPPKPYSE